MKKVVAFKYVIVLACVLCGGLAVYFTPDLYQLSDLNLGFTAAFGFATCGTLVWDSVDD